MAEKKKPKPGPSTGGSSTSRIKKPKGSQPLTLGTGGLRTGKVSKKQQAGTRKVVGAIAAVTPVGRAAKGASNLAGKAINQGTRKKYGAGVYQTDGIRPGVKDAVQARKISKGLEKYWKKEAAKSGSNAPKQPNYPSGLVSVKNKPRKPAGLETRGKRVTVQQTTDRARAQLSKVEMRKYSGATPKKSDKEISRIGTRVRARNMVPENVAYARENLAKLHGAKTKDAKMRKAIQAANKRGLKAANKKK
jgi:hypothetical protein